MQTYINSGFLGADTVSNADAFSCTTSRAEQLSHVVMFLNEKHFFSENKSRLGK